jgi:molybdopterin/thiamine biosynthesis adenylyltransferase
MNAAAKRENNRSLAEMLKIGEEDAATLLNVSVGITFSEEDVVSADVAGQVASLLGRTVAMVSSNSDVGPVAAELLIGDAQPRHDAPKIWLRSQNGRVIISRRCERSDRSVLHPIVRLISACYACAAVIKAVIGDRLPYPSPDEFYVDIDDLLGGDASVLRKEVEISETYLAGAGAIGNGFVLGLLHLKGRGKIYVVDDDQVSDGNLQRCALFQAEDVGKFKAQVLCDAAARVRPAIEFIPKAARLQDLSSATNPAWLKRLVVAVDSPRARRNLQNEIPGEVFDASTTGAAEIVFHYHIQPNPGACLCCVYPSNPDEHAHERHIAEALGVSLADVRQIKVSPEAAAQIVAKYPALEIGSVINAPYDTLFKALCSGEKLSTPEGRDALTPFAFISTLAGALLALEFIRRSHRGHTGLPNFWRISPWHNPMTRNRRHQPRREGCEFCCEPVMRAATDQIWGADGDSTPVVG